MTDKPLSIRVPVDFLEEIDRFAEERNMNRKGFVLACLRKAIDGAEHDTAMVTSMDRMGGEVIAAEGRLNEKLATGMAEINGRIGALEARFDELEEFHTHHLYNFLAYVAPDADEEAAAARGRKRLVNTMRALENVRSGKLRSLFLRAREEAARQESEEVAGTARAGNQLAK